MPYLNSVTSVLRLRYKSGPQTLCQTPWIRKVLAWQAPEFSGSFPLRIPEYPKILSRHRRCFSSEQAFRRRNFFLRGGFRIQVFVPGKVNSPHDMMSKQELQNKSPGNKNLTEAGKKLAGHLRSPSLHPRYCFFSMPCHLIPFEPGVPLVTIMNLRTSAKGNEVPLPGKLWRQI